MDQSNKNKNYSILSSIEEAIEHSSNTEWIAELYLCSVTKNTLSREYKKLMKKITKNAVQRSKCIKKLNKKPKNKKAKHKLKTLESNLLVFLRMKETLVIQTSKISLDFFDPKAIAKGLLKRYHGGLKIKDAYNQILTYNSAYGRFVRTVYKQLCPNPIMKKIIAKLIHRKTFETPYDKDKKSYWKNKYIKSRNQALLVEQAFILYLLSLALDDFTEDEIRRMLDEIATEIQSIDETLAAKIRDIRNGTNIAEGAAKAMIQVVRLSIGKGVFMNASVKITNAILRVILKKGMTYPQNAVFRKWVAKILGKGQWNIWITVVMFIPDVFDLFHKRDRGNVITALLLLYQMRHDNCCQNLKEV